MAGGRSFRDVAEGAAHPFARNGGEHKTFLVGVVGIEPTIFRVLSGPVSGLWRHPPVSQKWRPVQ
jgi:hypothetical protein